MVNVRVIIPFIRNDMIVPEGEVLEVPQHVLEALGDHVEVISDGPTYERQLHEQSSAYAAFCLWHENTITAGICPVKNSRRDPMTACLWWQQMRRPNATSKSLFPQGVAP